MSKFTFVFFVLFGCIPTLALTQEGSAPGTATTQTTETAAHGEGQIALDVVVTDKTGKPVPGLELKDFALLDNKLPAKILSFDAFGGGEQKPNPPVKVILVIDAVNLPFGQVSNERQQIVNFLKENSGRLAQPTSVVVMTDSGLTSSGQPTLDGNALAAATAKLNIGLRTTGQSAGAWGAIERLGLSLDGFMTIADNEAKTPGRKLLIWAGPGWPMLNGPHYETDNKSQQHIFNTIVQLSDQLRHARISVYSVALGMPGRGTFVYQDFLKGVKTAEKADSANLALKVLAVQSGGRAMVPDNDLKAQIDRCIDDAAAFYTISFDPPRADRANEYHDLKIEVDKPGLMALTKTGYYDQP